jgi:hypothetical protein
VIVRTLIGGMLVVMSLPILAPLIVGTLVTGAGVPSFPAPDSSFPRLTTGSVQVSSKTGELQ